MKVQSHADVFSLPHDKASTLYTHFKRAVRTSVYPQFDNSEKTISKEGQIT